MVIVAQSGIVEIDHEEIIEHLPWPLVGFSPDGVVGKELVHVVDAPHELIIFKNSLKK